MGAFYDIGAALNKEQLLAATALWQGDADALQVIAGAGSGKTTTLVAAVFAAVEAGYKPERIAVITFSRRAAHELKERFAAKQLIPGYCGTMHALAWKFIRAEENPPRLLLNAEKERGRMARELFPEFGHIPEQILLSGDFLDTDQREKLAHAYAGLLARENKIDFDGMITRATQAEPGNGKFDAVLVDEFQDTSPDQVAFIRSLRAQKLFVVGDDWQSIYRFRGADVAITQNFLRHFDNARRVYLVQNYRSGKPIVKLGNRVIRSSRVYVKKQLKATHPAYSKPTLFFAAEAVSPENVWVGFLAAWRRKFPEPQAKTTVLVRTNAIRLLLEKNKPDNFEILTIHKSKGLEFDNAVVFGVAEHLLPHRGNDADEEIRILYVALTRAKRFLGFVAWEKNGQGRSVFLPLLMRECRLVYI